LTPPPVRQAAGLPPLTHPTGGPFGDTSANPGLPGIPFATHDEPAEPGSPEHDGEPGGAVGLGMGQRANPGLPSAFSRASEEAHFDRPVEVVYRASLAPLPARVEEDTAESDPGAGDRFTGGRRTEPAPADLASDLHSALGVDVAGIPVHRGPGVSRQARTLSARAFTTGGEVFLPDEAGPVSDPRTRALLGHELVHAAQQRLLGPSRPTEDTARGHQLEQVAVDAEEWLSGRATAPRSLTDPARRATQQTPGTPGAPADAWLPAVAGPGGWSAAASPGIQRAVEQPGSAAELVLPLPPAATGAREPSFVDAMAPAADFTNVTSFTWPPPEMSGLTASAGPVGGPSGAGFANPGEIAALRDAVSELRASVTALREQPEAEAGPASDSPERLDELADQLLPRMRLGLRHELLVDRERSGLLSDFGSGGR
jgi:hypothetical protein